MKKKIAIIGAGASGMMAAIQAAEAGADVEIYEHMKPGKKILVTGNGKCNLGNRELTKESYFSNAPEKVWNCVERFNTDDTIRFFEEIGLCIKEKNGYLYPLSEQAGTVVQLLLNRIAYYRIPIISDEEVISIDIPSKKKQTDRNMSIRTNVEIRHYDAVIMACGSKAAPKTGSDGSGYDLARKLGHTVIPVLPALVQLRCKDSFFKEISGIRSEVKIHIYDNKKIIATEDGELQITDYGISGIPVFQLSGAVNRYLFSHEKADLVAEINFLPNMDDRMFQNFCKNRIHNRTGCSVDEFFYGILNQKLMRLFLKICDLKPETKMKNADKEKIQGVFSCCRSFRVHISGTNGFDNAQVCTGGIDMKEVSEDLESLIVPNLYFAGEILDVDGRCGGYNLQWAWTSGFIAGRAAGSKKV